MRVRQATQADLEAVLDLLRADVVRAIPEPSMVTDAQRRAMAELVADPDADVLVGDLDGRVVATCQVNWLRHLTHDGGLICQLEAVRVAAEHRGAGLGRQLVDVVLDAARVRGAVRVQLTTNRQRAEAHRWYERCGFVASHVGMKLYLGDDR